jgi:hypothetical protein
MDSDLINQSKIISANGTVAYLHCHILDVISYRKKKGEEGEVYACMYTHHTLVGGGCHLFSRKIIQ